MLIYLIRHGETAFNSEKRYQGSLDISLSEEGREKLAAADFCPEVVYTSYLRRTRETARAIFPEAKLIPVGDLREMSFGDYEGRTQAELADDEAHQIWLASGFTGCCPNQEESHQQFVERTCRAFSTLVDEALDRGEERLVIVAHGGTQMAVMSSFVGGVKRYGQWLTGNAEGYLLDTELWKEQGKLLLVGREKYTKVRQSFL